jgi:hypothetical protein
MVVSLVTILFAALVFVQWNQLVFRRLQMKNAATQSTVRSVAATVPPQPTATSGRSVTSPQPATASGASEVSPSGQPMPVGDIPGWHQIFADNFTTNVPLGEFPQLVATKWSDYPDGWEDTYRSGQYYPSKVVSIQNGIMNLYLHTENGIHMVAAPEPILPGAVGKEGGLLYGRYAIRFRADPLFGYKVSWLLWPDSEVWPRDGEIDFPEGVLFGNICGYMHRQNATAVNDQASVVTQSFMGSWHTAIIEWTPARLSFILDGTTVLSTTERIPDTPMHWVLQTETSRTPPSNQTAGNVQIAWVVVYVPSNTTSTLNSGRSFSASISSLNPITLFPLKNAFLNFNLQMISMYNEENSRWKLLK